MKNGIIMYQSKYGATKKYAIWLVEMTGFDCMETPKATLDIVSQYNTILLCGGIYASGIAGLSFLKRHWSVPKSAWQENGCKSRISPTQGQKQKPWLCPHVT